MVTEDIIYARVLANIISNNLKKFPDSTHILIPQYGIYFYDNPESSKYPKVLKKAHIFFEQVKNEYKKNRLVLNEITSFLRKQSCQKNPNVINTKLWLYYLAKAHIQYFCKISSISGHSNNLEFIENFKVKNILVGDLIADSYIRYKGVPDFEFKDAFVRKLIITSTALHELYSQHICDSPTKGFFYGQYSTYVHHGVPLRIAFNNFWTCTTFASSTSFFKIHTHTDMSIKYGPRHTEDHILYTVNSAKKLPSRLIHKADKILMERVEGIYDQTMGYMSSRFHDCSTQQNQIPQDQFSSARVLMLHDFFDSVHAYNWLLYPDFWSWCIDTIEFCLSNNLPLYIKPHPNEISSSRLFSNRLRSIYKDENLVRWIDPQVKNIYILKQKPKLLITVYGSVVAECAYCDVPVLLAGDHPALNFGLGLTAKTITEYQNALLNPELLHFTKRRDYSILFTALHHRKTLSRQGDSLKLHFKLHGKSNNELMTKLWSADVQNYLDLMIHELEIATQNHYSKNNHF